MSMPKPCLWHLLLLVAVVFSTAELSAQTILPSIRVTEYYITDGTQGKDFDGTAYTVTLDQDLANDYFIFVRGSRTGDAVSSPDSDYARVTGVPGGSFGLTSTSNDQIELTRGDNGANDDPDGVSGTVINWEGVVTVVECLANTGTSGFTLVEIFELNMAEDDAGGAGTGGDVTITGDWGTSAAQIVPFGGYRGGGVQFNQAVDGATTTTDRSDLGPGAYLNLEVDTATTNGLIWSRDAAGEKLLDVTTTVFVVQWGSDWIVQHADITGNNGGGGLDATGEFNNGALATAIDPTASWLWATGTTDNVHVGQCAEAVMVTIGDGVNQTNPDAMVSAATESSDTIDFDVYVMTNTTLGSNLVVEHVNVPDGNNGNGDLDVTITDNFSSSAPSRMAWSYNSSSGNGDGHPNSRHWARITDDTTAVISRGSDGNMFTAWLQSINFENITYDAGATDDADSTLVAGPGAESTTIQSTQVNSYLDVMDFTVGDTGGVDASPTIVSSFNFDISAASGTIDATDFTWRLNSTSLTDLAPDSVSSDLVVFTNFPGGDINIAEGATETFVLEAQMNQVVTGTTDGSRVFVELKTNGGTTESNVVTNGAPGITTTMAPDQTVDNSPGLQFQVTATEIQVIGEIGIENKVKIDEPFNVIAAYTDVNGNIDINITGDVLTCRRSDTNDLVGLITVIQGVAQYVGSSQIELEGPNGVQALTLEFTDDAAGIDLSGTTYSSPTFKLLAPPSITSISPDEGSLVGGEVVTLTGVDFDEVIWVTFAGISAAIIDGTQSSTSIQVTTPTFNAPEFADVVVSDGAFSDTLVDAFKVGEPNAEGPVISVVTPAFGFGEGGDPVTISGSGLDGSTVMIGALEATIVATTATRIDILTPPGPVNTDVDVVVTNSIGSDTFEEGFRYLTLTAPFSQVGTGSLTLCHLNRHGGIPLGLAFLTLGWLVLRLRRRRTAA